MWQIGVVGRSQWPGGILWSTGLSASEPQTWTGRSVCELTLPQQQRPVFRSMFEPGCRQPRATGFLACEFELHGCPTASCIPQSELGTRGSPEIAHFIGFFHCLVIATYYRYRGFFSQNYTDQLKDDIDNCGILREVPSH